MVGSTPPLGTSLRERVIMMSMYQCIRYILWFYHLSDEKQKQVISLICEIVNKNQSLQQTTSKETESNIEDVFHMIDGRL